MTIFISKARGLFAALGLGLLTACSTTDVATQGAINDPFEDQNRKRFAISQSVDRAVVRPVALGYVGVVPEGIRDNVKNVSDNLGVPSSMINQVLQGDVRGTGINLLRFSINSTLGLAGLADVAGDWGLEPQTADFGQTLAVWGVPQGAYLVVPLIGPSSQRALTGTLVDIVLNPLTGRLYPNPAIPAPYDLVATGARVATAVGQRGRFKTTIDGLLYESVDPYAASRDVYLQNRAFELEQKGVASAGNTEAEDLYDDIFGD